MNHSNSIYLLQFDQICCIFPARSGPMRATQAWGLRGSAFLLVAERGIYLDHYWRWCPANAARTDCGAFGSGLNAVVEAFSSAPTAFRPCRWAALLAADWWPCFCLQRVIERSAGG